MMYYVRSSVRYKTRRARVETMQAIMHRTRRALRLDGMAADAYHLLSAIPSAALVCFLLSPRSALRCFALYGLYGYLPLPRDEHTLGARALTIGMAWHSLDEQFVPPRSDGTNSMRLPAAVVVGLLLEVACRNAMNVLESLTSSRLPRDLSLAITADRWPRGSPPPPRRSGLAKDAILCNLLATSTKKGQNSELF